MEELIDKIPNSFNLYEEGDLSVININGVKDYLKEITAIKVSVCGNIYNGLSEKQIESIAQKIARLRIKDPMKRALSNKIFDTEVNYEKERIKDPTWKTFGILYEGLLYQQVMSGFILEGILNEQFCTVLLTNQLIGTWDQNSLRYHIRTSIYGFPHIISIPGLVMGPAKPREFYLKRQMGVTMELLIEEYKGKFLEHGDWRMTEILKGYIIQAFFYHLTGNPFCEDRNCRLFNSHWQEEMIHAQLGGTYEFCPRHEEILNRVRDRFTIK